MSKIFDALRKAEQEPSPLVPVEKPRPQEGGAHPRRLRIYEREFGRLSSALQSYFTRTSQGKVILTIGCSEGEGATYVSTNLARVLASSSGSPVLCADANFHDPGVSRVFGIGDSRGLADIYQNGNGKDISGLIRAGDVNNLYLMTAGQRRIAPVAFFDSAEFDALLTSLRRTFRFSIIDGPPLLKHPDAIHLASRVDGVILVVRYKHLKREFIRKGIEMLESVDAPILGSVLNRRKFAIPTLIYKLIS